MVAEGLGLFCDTVAMTSFQRLWFANNVPMVRPCPRCPGLSMSEGEVIPGYEPGGDAVGGDPQDKHGEAASFAPPPMPRNPGSRSLRGFQQMTSTEGGGHMYARTAVGICMFEPLCLRAE